MSHNTKYSGVTWPGVMLAVFSCPDMQINNVSGSVKTDRRLRLSPLEGAKEKSYIVQL